MELLGVIIILGALATLITYTVINIIEDARRDSAIQSAEQLIRIVTLNYTENDNFTTDKLNVLDYNYEGSKPEYGYIQFNEKEQPRLYMLYNGYCVTKKYDGKLEAIKLDKDELCDWNIN